MKSFAFSALALALITMVALPAQPKDDGYRGIWYSNQPSKDEYG